MHYFLVMLIACLTILFYINMQQLLTDIFNQQHLLSPLILLLGSENQKIREMRHTELLMHGYGKDKYHRTDVERLFRHLVIDGVLAEELVITAQEHAACYIKLGRRAGEVLAGSRKVGRG